MTDIFSTHGVEKEFAVHSELNRNFWPTDDTLHPKVRKALLLISKMFMKTLELPVKILDVTFTGSLANYNYSNESDVDLHIVIDYTELSGNKTLVEEYLALKKNHWNTSHDIRLFGHEVEVYIEDVNNPHITTGLFSVAKNKWITSPSGDKPKFDPGDVATKAKYFKNIYSILVRQYKANRHAYVIAQIDSLKEKIREMRKAGLSRGGQFSTENLAFKVLRRSGLLDRLTRLKQLATDAALSVQ